ncbi:MAG: SRPBCC family protein [Gammaproteobacteria bacterium]|nr:SRPBCC family protein [Gammaproteobacteria bacterium]
MVAVGDGGTRLTWAFDANFDNMPGHYMGLMVDKWVGSDYERGLERFKALAES